MSEEISQQHTDGKDSGDSRADALAMVVIYVAAVAMAVHFISGWTFDF